MKRCWGWGQHPLLCRGPVALPVGSPGAFFSPRYSKNYMKILPKALGDVVSQILAGNSSEVRAVLKLSRRIPFGDRLLPFPLRPLPSERLPSCLCHEKLGQGAAEARGQLPPSQSPSPGASQTPPFPLKDV